MSSNFSRRDFLKLGGVSVLGLVLPEVRPAPSLVQDRLSFTQGRIVYSGIALYDAPSFRAKKLKIFGRDEVVPLTEEVVGDDPHAYNPSWYHIGEEGFTYSGWVQPVRTVYNQPIFQILATGILAEVTVPYTDIRRGASMYADRSFRLFYASTHWVTGMEINRDEKGFWYCIYDDFLKTSYYVQAQDLRIIPDEELAPLSPNVPNSLKHIRVDLASQMVVAYENDKPVLSTRCASGTKGTKTPLGFNKTYHKASTVHMTDAEERESGTFDLPGVPWVTFFTGTGISFHGTYWHNDYGRPRSHGCINLTPEAAKFIYLWTQPTVPPETRYLYLPGEGTTVEIVKSQV